jgi:pSer/pThr/pTyr-binding forkhead associated (FHA) protein
MGTLTIVSNKQKGQTWSTISDRETVIGRTRECDICLPDLRASRKHCAIYVTPSGYVVRDLGSVNGTFVNGKRIAQALVKDGDRLLVGSTEMSFYSGASVPMPVFAQVDSSIRTPVFPQMPVSPHRRASGEALQKIEFCSRCSGSITAGQKAAGLTRVIDGELLCSECLGLGSSQVQTTHTVERMAGRTALGGGSRTVQTATPPASKPPRSLPLDNKTTPSRQFSGLRAYPALQRNKPNRVKGRLGMWANLVGSLAVLALCLFLIPGAWLNFQGFVQTADIRKQSVALEEVSRSPVTITVRYAYSLDDGTEIQSKKTGGIFTQWRYDQLNAQARAMNGTAKFDIVYNAARPEQSAFYDALHGLPVLIVSAIMLLWLLYEIQRLIRSYVTHR